MKTLFLAFLKLGFSAFGGPAAHIALMEEEFVVRRKWLTHEDLLDMIGATNIIPGPNSTELALHIGYRKAGWPGLFAAGAGFISPALLLTILLAVAYLQLGRLPKADAVLSGFQAAAVGLILAAVWRMGKKAVKTSSHGLITLLAAGAAWWSGHEIASLFLTAFLGMGILSWKKLKGASASILLLMASASAQAAPFLFHKSGKAQSFLHPYSIEKLFFYFLKIGAILYGSGYVLFAFLEGGLVNELGWLNSGQLLDAVAAGQLTPGPVLSTSAFIGTILGGPVAGLAAAAGIFLPSFFFVLVLAPVLPRIKDKKAVRLFLDSINAAAIGLMAWVGLELLVKTGKDIPLGILCVVLTWLIAFRQMKGPLAIAFGGAAGLVIQLSRQFL